MTEKFTIINKTKRGKVCAQTRISQENFDHLQRLASKNKLTVSRIIDQMIEYCLTNMN